MITAERILAGLMSVLATAGLALGGAAMSFALDAERQMVEMRTEQAHLIRAVDKLNQGDESNSKQWRYLSYLQSEVNKLRHQLDLPPLDAPDLGD